MRRLQKHLCDFLRAKLAGAVAVVPAGGVLLLRWFEDLSDARTWHAAGPNPITYSDIASYAMLHRLPLTPEHVDTIAALDIVWTGNFYERRQNETSDVKKLPKRSEHPVSADLFDAMFG